MYECIHIGVYMRMCTKMHIVTLGIIDINMVNQQSTNSVKVFVIERSTVELKIRNLRKLICTWDVIEGVKELWVKGLKLWLMRIITDQSDR